MITTFVIFGLAIVGGFIFLLFRIKLVNSMKDLEISDLKGSIEDVKKETPALTIKNNEAYLHTRDGREIHRYQLTKKK